MTDEKNLPELLKGWVWARIGNVSNLNKKTINLSEYDPSMSVSFVPMRSVSAEKGIIENPEIRSLSKVRKGYTQFIDNDVLFAKITPCMENGKAAIARNLKNGIGFGSTEFHVIRPFSILIPAYIYHFVRQVGFRKEAMVHFTGSVGQKRVPKQFLQNKYIPLPPLPEQHRIVAKIETLFTRLDAGVAALTTLKTQLKRYRQAVLKSAMEGKLTAKWREERNISIMHDWDNLLMKDILVDIKYGTSKKCAYNDTLTPVLRIPNVVNGTIDTNDMKYTSLEPKDFEKLRLKCGDILIIRSNGSLNLVGRSALITKKVEDYCYAGYLIRLRINNQKADSKFINYLIHSHLMRMQIEKKAKSTSGVNNINSKEISSLRINLPQLSEQIEIVKMIEEKFSNIDETVTIISQSLTRAERLRQSILKRAFEGKLVSQDPNDEPASKLLERIREEKAKMETKSKGKRRGR